MGRMNVERRMLLAGLGGALAGSVLSTARAGQLKPPAGPIAPSGRSTAELYDRIARTDAGVAEPRCPVQSQPGSDTAAHVISASGSYYLTQNLEAPAGKNAIEIHAPNVDLDLCGFHVMGSAGNPGTAPTSGILTDQQNVTITDGSVLGFDYGVNFEAGSRCVIWDIVSINASRCGFVLGDRGETYDCAAYSSKGAGFSAPRERALIEDNAAWSCVIGFLCTGTRNLFLCNCASESGSIAFEIGQGNSYAPIVDVSGVGDMSMVPNNDHPCANYVH